MWSHESQNNCVWISSESVLQSVFKWNKIYMDGKISVSMSVTCFIAFILKVSYTTQLTFVVHCSRRNWNTGAWILIKWSRAVGWRIQLTATRRKRYRSWIVLIWTVIELLATTNWPSTRRWMETSQVTSSVMESCELGAETSRSSGNCSTNPTRQHTPRWRHSHWWHNPRYCQISADDLRLVPL